MLFLFNRLTLAGKGWTTYFLLLIAGWFLFCGAALASEKHGYKPPEKPVWIESMPDDNWGGWKAHVGISAGIGMLTGYAVEKSSLEPKYRLPVAFGLCLVPGLVREANTYYDHPAPGYRHGLFSGRDMVSNAVGCGIGMLSYRGIRAIVTPKSAALVIDKTF